jgi:hypothetical protein
VKTSKSPASCAVWPTKNQDLLDREPGRQNMAVGFVVLTEISRPWTKLLDVVIGPLQSETGLALNRD